MTRSSTRFVVRVRPQRVGLIPVLGTMEPALSQVYQALLQLQEQAGITLSFQDDLREGFANGAKFYSADLAQFNQLASELSNPADVKRTLEILGKLRLLSLALEDEFRGVSDAIQKLASELARHGA
jgi:hypothetical protein